MGCILRVEGWRVGSVGVVRDSNYGCMRGVGKWEEVGDEDRGQGYGMSVGVLFFGHLFSLSLISLWR